MFHFYFKELEAIKARVREMEEEAEKLKQLQSEVDKQILGSPGSKYFLFFFSITEFCVSLCGIISEEVTNHVASSTCKFVGANFVLCFVGNFF